MSKLFNWAAARLAAAFALALCFATPLVSWADAITAVNPVTGDTETYTYKFTGTDTWNGVEYWQDSNGDHPSAVPAKSGDNIWDPILFDGNTINIAASMSVEGWNLRLGLYNGANVRLNSFVKWQGDTDMWVTVDGTSKFTVGAFAKGNIADGKAIKCSTTRANGIEWLVNLESTGNANNTFEYYLAGEGSVSYQGVTAANHKIKQADVALSGNEKSVQSKTLVSFTSTDKTFTADAAIKVKNGDNVLKTVYLTSVTADATTLTTDDDVGACELVQTSTGIVLYYVDGDPADVPVEEKTYKPSININFTSGAANGLTTQADVGLSGYEVPGTSWNNYVVANSTFSSVNAIDSTGAASAMSGVSVTISNVSGSWGCSGLTASSDFRQSYIDESASYPTPTVTVSGIPYYKYRVLVYHSTDTKNVPFGYDTINGTNYTYVNDALAEGTTAWGDSGAKDSANAIAEGGNVLETEALSGSTLTVVGHRAGGANNARGCIAAIQIVEVKADVGENDLEIPVAGDTPYTVEETKELSGTVYLTGSGTLTLAGENKISAATIDVGDLVTLVVNADRLDGTTFTGGGTVVYNNALPVTGKGWTDSSAWTGTVWINGKSGVTDFNVNSYGNANSAVKLSGVDGWISAPFDNTVPVILENGEFEYALKLTNGNSPNNQYPKRCTTFVKVSGSGTISDGGSANPMLKIYDGTKFTGALTLTRARVVFCAADSTTLPDAYNTGIPAASIYVDSGNSATVASGKTWTADGGFVVNGTLNANGTLASSLATKAVSGAGTVVFGGVPSPTGDAWWKNSDWNGTVQIGNITDMIGRTSGFTGTYLDFNSYGNANSLVKLGNLTGWMDNYTCNVPVNLAGTLTINNGISGEVFTFKKLISSGGYITATDQSATFSIRIEDGSEYAGYIGLNSKRVIFGTGTAPAFVKGQIYVSSDATITVPSVNTAYWSVGGILIDGELKADNLARFGGGTNITTGDDGVFTLTSTGNGSEGETDTDYARIKGTGSLKYDGTGWRALSTNNFPTAVTLVNEQAGDILLSRALTYTVGSLSGSKNFQGNYGSGNRYLNVIQSKDTEWSGKVVNDGSSRFAGLKLDASSTGTLTLSGTASQNVALEVNGGAVNLTGTWVGATTVAGTFGGTGTLTGDLTFSNGATFKAFAADDADGLVVSGAVTYPAEGTVTVDVSAIEPETDVALIKAADLNSDKFTLAAGAPEGYSLEVVEGVLTLMVPHVTITVPSVANTTVIVKIGDETIGTASGDYNVAPDSFVTVTYAAVEGYEISGTTEYTIDTSNNETTFDPAGTTEVKQYVAYVVFQQESGQSFIDVTNNYTTVSNAIDAAKAMKKTVVLIAQPEATDTYNISVGETINVKKGEFTFDGIIFPEGSQYNNTTTEIAGVTQYKCTTYTATVQYPGQEPVGMTGQLIQILGGLYSGYVPGYAGTVVTVLDGSDSTVGDAMPDVFTYDSEVHTYTLKTMVASINTGAVDIYYPTISNAFEAVVSGQTIKVLCDNTSNVRSVRVKEGATVTLDLNGCTVTGPSEDNPMFWLEDNSNFVVTDTTEDKAGKLVSEASKVVWSNNRCTFTLTAGTLESTMDVPIYIYFSGVNGSRIVNINGGKLVSSTSSSSNGDFCIMNANGIVNMTAGEIVSTCGGIRGSESSISGGTITVNRGVFYNTENQRVTGGTFNKDVSEYVPSGYEVVNNGNGTYTVREDRGWVYAAPGYWNYTGAWSEGAALGTDKVTIESNATYTASNPSAGQLVTVEMSLSFDDVNDDVYDVEDAKSAVRLAAGETDGTYQFQLYTSDGVNRVWTNATVDVTANKEVDYAFVFVLDLTNKTYTASIVSGTTTNAMTVGGVTNILFACQDNVTPVQRIDFVGSGAVTSIKGSYEDAPAPVQEFVDGETIGSVEINDAQATWLNGQNNYLALVDKIATMSQEAFNKAYLLNLNVTDPAYDGTFTFEVTDFTVDDTTVSVKVTLTRKGEFDGPIIGTLKLTGTDELGNAFEVKDLATITDAHFDDGDGTVTISFTKDGNTKFFKPVIE